MIMKAKINYVGKNRAVLIVSDGEVNGEDVEVLKKRLKDDGYVFTSASSDGHIYHEVHKRIESEV